MSISEVRDLTTLIDNLQQTTSSKEKMEILKRFPQCTTILEYALSPRYKYYVTGKGIRGQLKIMRDLEVGPLQSAQYKNLYDLLEALNDRVITGTDAIQQVLALLWLPSYQPYEETILRILDRDLKVRVDASLINKVYPGCIPTFKVALAYSYKDHKDKVDFQKDVWLASRKYDGNRLLTEITTDIKCYSRKGEEFTTLDELKKLIRAGLITTDQYVLDGEVCIVDSSGLEHFSDLARLINRDNYTIEHPRYYVFDVLTKEEFDAGESSVPLLARLARFSKVINDATQSIVLAPQHIIENEEHMMSLFDDALSHQWEGLIIRKDTGYKATRSADMLKVKKFQDAEYVVEGVVPGKKRMLVNGVDTERDVLSAFIINHKGTSVYVGSGLSDDQRLYYFDHPEELIGKTVTVQYFQETENLNGTTSLRFPVLKHIYENGRQA